MIKGLRSIRPISKESLRGVEPAANPGKRPKFEWIDPATLFVEEAYQRDFTDNGTRLVRKIVGGFSWSRLKPPVCVRDADSGVLVVIDGQHTAIAAASHPGVDKIPVMIVDASDVAARAGAFVGHNRDRIALTQMAVYHGEVAAGDETALAMDRALKAAGATILTKSINLKHAAPVGSTIAVGTIRALAKARGEAFLTRVLSVLVKAERGPLKAEEIAAVAAVLAVDPEDTLVDARLLVVVRSKTTEQWSAIAASASAESGKPGSTELGAFWASMIGIGVESSPTKAHGKGSVREVSRDQLVRKAPAAAAPRPAPPEPPRPAPPVSSPAPIIVPRQPEENVKMDGKPSVTRFVEWNGIKIDLKERKVSRGDRETVIRDDAIRLVAALARVMPAFLPDDILAKKVFGRAAAGELLRDVILAANPALAAAGLEVRQVPKMGHMLADLG